MRMSRIPRVTFVTILTASALLGACSSSGQEVTPTLNSDQIATGAVATFSAGLTSTAASLPTSTPTLTETASPAATSTQAGSSTPSQTQAGAAATATCYGLTFVSDVTVPDNTEMTSGQSFTKTWRVRNSGSCAWQPGFEFAYTGGEALGGSSIELEEAVETGTEIDLSVEMTAPNAPGTFRSNWRMSTLSGTYFGDEVYVLIVVGESTATPEPTETTAASETPSSTPER